MSPGWVKIRPRIVSAGIRRLLWILISVITSCCAAANPQSSHSTTTSQPQNLPQPSANKEDSASAGRLRRHSSPDADLSLRRRRIAYYLSFLEFGKPQLYGRAVESVQIRARRALTKA